MFNDVDRRSAAAHTARSLALLVAACLVAGGCYQYVAADAAAVPEGARVRAHIAPTAAARLGAGPLQARVVEVSADGALLLQVARPGTAPQVGVSARPLFERIRVGRDELTSLELKRLHRGRTVLFVAGSGVAAGLLVQLAFNTSGGGSEKGGPVVNEILIPVFSLRW